MKAVQYLSKSRDLTAALQEAKMVLKGIWGTQARMPSNILHKILEGGSLKKNDSEGIHSLIAKLKDAYMVSVEANDISTLTSLDSIQKILKAKVPFVIDRFMWYSSRIDSTGQGTSFHHFLKFFKNMHVTWIVPLVIL